MTGVTALLAGMSGNAAGTVSLSNLTVYRGTDGTLATATYTLLSDGTLTSTGNPSGAWITPQIGMDLFEVRATLTSGSLTSGTTGSWLSLGTTRAWSCVQAGDQGITSGTITVEIRRIGETTILASATVTITAEIFQL